MIAAGVVEIFLGVEAAQKQLEDIAKPLTAEDAEAAGKGAGAGDLDLDRIKGEDAAPIKSKGAAASSGNRASAPSKRAEVSHEHGLVAIPFELSQRR